jgi:hypothetical protein
MKRFYKKVFKSKTPSLVSLDASGHGPATSTSTFITSTTDLMPSIRDATASAHVTAGVTGSVSVQRSALPIASLEVLIYCYRADRS